MKENNNTKPFFNTTIPSDWDLKRIDNCAPLQRGFDLPVEQIVEGEYPVVFSNGILKSHSEFKAKALGVVTGRSGTIGKVTFIEKDYWPHNTALWVTDFKGNEPKYIYYFYDYFDLKRFGSGSGVPTLNRNDVHVKKIPLPPLPEQRAIAQILSLMDTAINKNIQLIAQKKLRKKWLIQNLLMGKKRLKGFRGEWRELKLVDILKVAGKPFIPIQDKIYQQIGIRSHTKGIFYKEKVTGQELGNKRVFKIEPNCFVVNIVFAWEHAIAKTSSKEVEMIASHRFPMYKPKSDILNLDYLLYYFKSLRGKYLLGLASPGGAGRNKTLGKSEFMKLKIPVPSIEEQTAIAQILQTADKEIELLQSKLDKLQEQKKGMMQVLLTGKKRLKVSEHDF